MSHLNDGSPQEVDLRSQLIPKEDRKVIWGALILILILSLALMTKGSQQKPSSLGHVESATPLQRLPSRAIQWSESKRDDVFLGDMIATGLSQRATLTLRNGDVIEILPQTIIELVRGAGATPEVLIHRGKVQSSASVVARREDPFQPFLPRGRSSLAMPTLPLPH